MNALLEIEDLSVSYGAGAPVLRDVSLGIGDGEIVAILGANGAGKSTLLRAISGMLPLNKGKIRFDGIDISAVSAHRRVELGIVHVPEGRQMLSGLSVKENLLLGAYTRRRERSSLLAETADEIYRLFPILKARHQQPAGSLSGGQQQMLALGRALMAKPRILMCDEPSLGIAPLVVAEVLAAIGTMRDRGVPVLLVEQNAKKALALANRGLVLKRGKVALTGTAGELTADENLSSMYLGA
jgi:branched-chain amino acid transport system ATP-binding protein